MKLSKSFWSTCATTLDVTCFAGVLITVSAISYYGGLAVPFSYGVTTAAALKPALTSVASIAPILGIFGIIGTIYIV